MLKPVLVALSALSLLGAMSPAWLSIESPVNPYESSTRGAVLLVHAFMPSGRVALSDVSGTAEGLVNGTRRSMPLRFEATPRENTFMLSRQWPVEGKWLLRITLHETTALVSVDAAGTVTSSRIPTVMTSGIPLPRGVSAREIDSTLAAPARN